MAFTFSLGVAQGWELHWPFGPEDRSEQSQAGREVLHLVFESKFQQQRPEPACIGGS